MNDKAPICLFDSGVGGLSVLQGFIRAFPYERYIYLADQKYCPYGNREDNYIINRIIKANLFFKSFNPKAIVIACNTASRFKKYFSQTSECVVIDCILPTANNVVKSCCKNVLLLATKSTINGGLYDNYLSKNNINCTSLDCSQFVKYIENCKFDNGFNRIIVQKLSSVTVSSFDGVILGCTHFLYAKHLIIKYLNGKITVFDSVLPLVCEIKSILGDTFSKIGTDLSVAIYTTGETNNALNTLKFYKINYTSLKKINLD